MAASGARKKKPRLAIFRLLDRGTRLFSFVRKVGTARMLHAQGLEILRLARQESRRDLRRLAIALGFVGACLGMMGLAAIALNATTVLALHDLAYVAYDAPWLWSGLTVAGGDLLLGLLFGVIGLSRLKTGPFREARAELKATVRAVKINIGA